MVNALADDVIGPVLALEVFAGPAAVGAGPDSKCVRREVRRLAERIEENGLICQAGSVS
jgi:hypothetical protein